MGLLTTLLIVALVSVTATVSVAKKSTNAINVAVDWDIFPYDTTLEGDDGGWRVDYQDSTVCNQPNSKCTIDRWHEDELSVEDFERVYRNRQPVIIYGGRRNQVRRADYTREQIHRRFGDHIVPVGTAETLYNGKEARRSWRMSIDQYLSILDKSYVSPLNDSYTMPPPPSSLWAGPHPYLPFTTPPPAPSLSSATNLPSSISTQMRHVNANAPYVLQSRRNFMTELKSANAPSTDDSNVDLEAGRTERLYFFEWHKNLGDAVRLVDEWKAAPYFKFGHKASERIIAIGGTDSGIPFHFHGEAWNELLYGRKRWFLYPPHSPPSRGYNDYHDQAQWTRDTYEWLDYDEKPVECFQVPGDIIYIPEGWYHSTVNCGQSLAIASQIQEASNLDPHGFIAEFTNAMTAQIQGADQVAMRHFDNALRVNPANELALFTAGRMYGRLGRAADAHSAIERSVRLNPRRAEGWIYLAASFLSYLGDSESALDALDQAFALRPPLRTRQFAYTMLAATYAQSKVKGAGSYAQMANTMAERLQRQITAKEQSDPLPRTFERYRA